VSRVRKQKYVFVGDEAVMNHSANSEDPILPSLYTSMKSSAKFQGQEPFIVDSLNLEKHLLIVETCPLALFLYPRFQAFFGC